MGITMKLNIVKNVNSTFPRTVLYSQTPCVKNFRGNTHCNNLLNTFWKFNKNQFRNISKDSYVNHSLHERCNNFSRKIAFGFIQGLKQVIWSFNRISTNFPRLRFNFSNYAPISTCFAIGSCLFSWKDNNIEDYVFTDCIDEIKSLHRSDDTLQIDESWEKIVEKDNLTIWRRPLTGTSLYEYKVYGTFTDISARNFFQVNTDLEYRKQWDSSIVKLDVIDQDPETSCQVVQWVCYFPFPMSSREYIYLRKSKIIKKENVMILIAKAIDHPQYPDDNKYVRVDTYD